MHSTHDASKTCLQGSYEQMPILHGPCGVWSQIFRISILSCFTSLTLGGSRTSDNLDELASNDGLTSSVVQNLELVDHVTSVLGRIIHGVLTSRDLASMTLSQCLINVSVRYCRTRVRLHTQKSELARAYSRRLGRTSSSISKAAKLAMLALVAFKYVHVRLPTRLSDSLLGVCLDIGGLVT